jgi:hypothetical protein
MRRDAIHGELPHGVAEQSFFVAKLSQWSFGHGNGALRKSNLINGCVKSIATDVELEEQSRWQKPAEQGGTTPVTNWLLAVGGIDAASIESFIPNIERIWTASFRTRFCLVAPHDSA